MAKLKVEVLGGIQSVRDSNKFLFNERKQHLRSLEQERTDILNSLRKAYDSHLSVSVDDKLRAQQLAEKPPIEVT